jgi:CelD/BcsL family acetyltransferase involved in cellulose biosynthesis
MDRHWDGIPLNPLRIEAVTSLDAVREEWGRLAEQSGNIFSTWEWASTWWRHYGRDRQLLLFVCRAHDGTLNAVLPLYLWSARPIRIARFLGHGPADQLGPICAPGELTNTAAALRQAQDSARVDLLLAELLPGGQGWHEALGSSRIHSEASPVLSLEYGWEAYLAARSANFRHQVRRRERRLRSRHSISFRLALDPVRLSSDLDTLFSLHAARWGHGASAFVPWESFHRDFAVAALERGWLRLWILELDETPVAAWYGFRFAGVESYYQAGRDPTLGGNSVGFVLLAHTIREAAADGMREYRLLRGAEAFKYRFAEADLGLETFAVARGLGGTVARVAAAAGLRSGLLRAFLRRLGGW